MNMPVDTSPKRSNPTLPLWEGRRLAYLADPERFKREQEIIIKAHHRQITTAIHYDHIMPVRKHSEGGAELQEVIDQMSKTAGITPPELIIWPSEHPIARRMGVDARTVLPEFIETNEKSIHYFLANQEEFKAVMAHEIGHIVNGDSHIAGQILQLTTPPAQKWEVLADRMGALVHGNPRKYTEASKSFFRLSPDRLHASSETHPSHYQAGLMLDKWTSILESNGVMNKNTGEIIDRKKALGIFDTYKDIMDLPLTRTQIASYR